LFVIPADSAPAPTFAPEPIAPEPIAPAPIAPAPVVDAPIVPEEKAKAPVVQEKPQGGASQPVHEEEHEKKKGENDDILRDFPISVGLTSVEAEELLRKFGRNELPEKVTPKWLIFVRLLYQPMPIMIWIAAIVEVGIGNYEDIHPISSPPLP
jgi:magnesium-transporting ATPase (P-type)